ncbi:zinc-binding dehydrogenase, partial [Klebsiella pneumoniae]|nr:zinc-binding dehydrogenase [Klebsiella pneumoniae]
DIPVPVFDILGKHLTVRGYELFEITTDIQKLANAKAFVGKGLAGGQLKPVIDQVFPLNEIAAAHRRMESNAQIGKIVVVVD